MPPRIDPVALKAQSLNQSLKMSKSRYKGARMIEEPQALAPNVDNCRVTNSSGEFSGNGFTRGSHVRQDELFFDSATPSREAGMIVSIPSSYSKEVSEIRAGGINHGLMNKNIGYEDYKQTHELRSKEHQNHLTETSRPTQIPKNCPAYTDVSGMNDVGVLSKVHEQKNETSYTAGTTGRQCDKAICTPHRSSKPITSLKRPVVHGSVTADKDLKMFNECFVTQGISGNDFKNREHRLEETPSIPTSIQHTKVPPKTNQQTLTVLQDFIDHKNANTNPSSKMAPEIAGPGDSQCTQQGPTHSPKTLKFLQGYTDLDYKQFKADPRSKLALRPSTVEHRKSLADQSKAAGGYAARMRSREFPFTVVRSRPISPPQIACTPPSPTSSSCSPNPRPFNNGSLTPPPVCYRKKDRARFQHQESERLSDLVMRRRGSRDDGTGINGIDLDRMISSKAQHSPKENRPMVAQYEKQVIGHFQRLGF